MFSMLCIITENVGVAWGQLPLFGVVGMFTCSQANTH